MSTSRKRTPVMDRLRAKTVEDGECWRFTGYHTSGGYGLLYTGSAPRLDSVHSISYKHHFGEVPPGKEIDHLCGTTDCWRPDHLEAVTHRENLMRGKTIVAELAARTHCPRGHEYTEANTYMNNGSRICRACAPMHDARRRARKAAS